MRAGASTLVEDVSFRVERGERVGLIGESGSGKSVTAMAVMGLLSDSLDVAGDIRVEGSPNLVGRTDRQIAPLRGQRMSMVFQEPMTALDPLQRVGAQVAEVMTIHGTAGRAAASARAVELLGTVGLPDPEYAARAYPHQLSGGQRQRVMIAMALANDPALLVADEPTTALDVTVQRQVLELLLDLVRERDTGLLFITHDLAVVASVCERVLVMERGRIVEQGPISRVFTAPEHPYTRGLLAASDLEATDADGRLFTVATAGAYVPGRRVDAAGRRAGGVPDAGARDGATPGGGAAASTAGHAPAPVVRVAGLTKTYTRRGRLLRGSKRIEALGGLDLEIAAGERFGIVGESGSGKSTLLRILAGLSRAGSGEVEVAGVRVDGASERELGMLRRQLQIVFQDPMGSLDPRMRVRDIVAEPLLNPANLRAGAGGEGRRELVARVLEQVGLPADAAERYPHEFSGGQRQRISIARALVCTPRVLLADEPVSALDVSVRAQVLNLLADLIDEAQLTLVFVSHDLGVVRYLCDRVAVMQAGRIVEIGPTEEIYERPQHPYTRSLVQASPSLEAVLGER
ncbi:dipeptide ABC transporter ATP-binding protein [Agromyces archimandritae]|uniref:dipeptide ABC transporter ATP-binding protein n=1 Tax=Agromyces archimandritae TaxID=2781962 RepID=UPI001FD31258|nr:ABC transporter ATP-binding protein [Agromyces archimandritae]